MPSGELRHQCDLACTDNSRREAGPGPGKACCASNPLCPRVVRILALGAIPSELRHRRHRLRMVPASRRQTERGGSQLLAAIAGYAVQVPATRRTPAFQAPRTPQLHRGEPSSRSSFNFPLRWQSWRKPQPRQRAGLWWIRVNTGTVAQSLRPLPIRLWRRGAAAKMVISLGRQPFQSKGVWLGIASANRSRQH